MPPSLWLLSLCQQALTGSLSPGDHSSHTDLGAPSALSPEVGAEHSLVLVRGFPTLLPCRLLQKALLTGHFSAGFSDTDPGTRPPTCPQLLSKGWVM